MGNQYDDELEGNPRAREIADYRRRIANAVRTPLNDEQMNDEAGNKPVQGPPLSSMSLASSKPIGFYAAMGLPEGYESPKPRTPQDTGPDMKSLSGADQSQAMKALSDYETPGDAPDNKYMQGYSGPTDQDIYDRRAKLNEGTNPIAKFFGAMNSNKSSEKFDKEYIQGPASAPAEDSDLLQYIKQKQDSYKQQQMTRDPASDYSKIQQALAMKQAQQMEEWGTQHGNAAIVQQARSLASTIPKMNGEEIQRMMGNAPAGKAARQPASPWDSNTEELNDAKIRRMDKSSEQGDTRIYNMASAKVNAALKTPIETLKSINQGIDSINNPNLTYDDTLHGELALLLAKVVGDTGKVVPQRRAEALKLGSLPEYIGKIMRESGAGPQDMIPASIKKEIINRFMGLKQMNEDHVRKNAGGLADTYEMSDAHRAKLKEQYGTNDAGDELPIKLVGTGKYGHQATAAATKPGSKRVVTPEELQEYSKKHGKSPQDAQKFLESQGYSIGK